MPNFGMIDLSGSPAAASDVPAVVVRSLVLILIVVAAFYGVMRLRRWMKEDDMPPGGNGFSLSDLRQMHRRGEMTDEEFEKAKAQMLAGVKSMASKMPDPLARPGSDQPRR